LELDEHSRFQNAEWAVQRAGWVLLLAVVVAALTGLFGTGPLSSTVADSADGRLRVEHEKYLRYRAPSMFEFTVQTAGSDELRISFDRPLSRAMEIQRVMPEPQQEELTDEEHVFVFRNAGGGGPARIRFHFEPDAFGWANGTVRLGKSSVVRVQQFIYP
jgi:hypothetical protein